MTRQAPAAGFVPSFERMTGLRLWPVRLGSAAVAAAVSAVAIAAGVIALEIAFAPAAERAQWTSIPLPPRLALSLVESLREEVVYRLGLMTLLAAAVRRLFPAAPPWTPCVGAALPAQLVLLAVMLPTPQDAAGWLFDAARYYLPGVMWGLVYWRHGFATAVAAHLASHVLIDPVLALTH